MMCRQKRLGLHADMQEVVLGSPSDRVVINEVVQIST